MSTFILNLNDTVALSDSALIEIAKVVNSCQPCVQETATNGYDVLIAFAICVAIVFVALIAKCGFLSWKEKIIDAEKEERNDKKSKDKEEYDRKQQANEKNRDWNLADEDRKRQNMLDDEARKRGYMLEDEKRQREYILDDEKRKRGYMLEDEERQRRYIKEDRETTSKETETHE